MSTKERIDTLLTKRGLVESREKAQRAIMAGNVLLDGHRIEKPGTRVATDAIIELKEKEPFVSRGGLKLRGALDHFHVDVTGLTCIDVGASTGGFTDCLLQRGATAVHAVDVGHSQLDWRIRSDPRVFVKEKFNARHMTPADFEVAFDLAVTDVSFISLTMVLGPVFEVLRPGGRALVLIKPQFEVGKHEVEAGGIIRDPAKHAAVVEKIRTFVEGTLGQCWMGVTDSPIHGTDGNKEFLACLQKSSES